MRRFPLAGSLLLAVLLTVSSAAGVIAQSPVASPVAAGHGIRIADMDQSVDPGQDFYQFANGGWLAGIEIPPDQASYGVFEMLTDLTEEQQLAQLDRLIADDSLPEGSDQWKAVEFYKQGIDMETRNVQGLSPLQAQLDAIAGVTDLAGLHALFASEAGLAIPNFFNPIVTPDPANSTVNTAWLIGPYLGLGDVTYYTEDSESNEAVRQAYKTMAAQFFQMAGKSEADATAAAQAVYDLEAAMAAQMVTPIEAQDFSVLYNPTTLDEMQQRYPLLDWQQLMTSAGSTVDGSSIIIDSEIRLMEQLAGILEATDLQTIKDYLALQLIYNASPYLSQEARDVRFGFIQSLTGATEQRRVEQYVLTAVNSLMPDAMGQIYVADYFSPESKAAIEQLVQNIIAAFRVRLENNAWMSEETKTAALEKLDAIEVKVGYPDRWQTYENYVVGDSYYATANDSLIAEYQEQMAKYGQPVDRTEWRAAVQEVNAFYSPDLNDITFPAAILQPPFFDADADPASNYGGIGYVIGHEITHGFDLQGSQFDKDGNFANWWTEADLAAFQALNDEVVAQYGQVEVLPGLFIDGQMTVTENVADMGGVQTAYDALQLALAQDGDPGEIDGLTQAQRFFIAAAQTWREKVRDAALQAQIQSGVHSPGLARATVPARNMDAFYEAFPEIEPGDPEYLAPEDRIVIW